jgi:hypothetical protein
MRAARRPRSRLNRSRRYTKNFINTAPTEERRRAATSHQRLLARRVRRHPRAPLPYPYHGFSSPRHKCSLKLNLPRCSRRQVDMRCRQFSIEWNWLWQSVKPLAQTPAPVVSGRCGGCGAPDDQSGSGGVGARTSNPKNGLVKGAAIIWRLKRFGEAVTGRPLFVFRISEKPRASCFARCTGGGLRPGAAVRAVSAGPGAVGYLAIDHSPLSRFKACSARSGCC